MASRADWAFRALNKAVLGTFGEEAGTVYLRTPEGQPIPVDAEWVQEPVTVEQGQSLVTAFQATLGLSLFEGTPKITTEWSVVARGEEWEIADVREPGDGWLVLQIMRA